MPFNPQFCSQCATPTPDGSGKCEDYPKCEALGLEEWRRRVDEQTDA